jgi:hypothetical protein
MGVEVRNVYKMLLEKPEGQRPLGIPRPDMSIILKWILRK